MTELVLRCHTTGGVIERPVNRKSAVLALVMMDLTKLPAELFSFTSITNLVLFCNKIRTLPSQISLLTTLEQLNVRQKAMSREI